MPWACASTFTTMMLAPSRVSSMAIWHAAAPQTIPHNPGNRAVVVADLARYLGSNPQEVTEPPELERQVQLRLASHCTLIVLDNAETLVEAVAAKDAAAIQLAQFTQQL